MKTQEIPTGRASLPVVSVMIVPPRCGNAEAIVPLLCQFARFFIATAESRCVCDWFTAKCLSIRLAAVAGGPGSFVGGAGRGRAPCRRASDRVQSRRSSVPGGTCCPTAPHPDSRGVRRDDPRPTRPIWSGRLSRWVRGSSSVAVRQRQCRLTRRPSQHVWCGISLVPGTTGSRR